MPNFGDQIVKQYMRRNRWFVPAPSVIMLAQTITVREGRVADDDTPDLFVMKQVEAALHERIARGEIKACKHAGGSGYRKASKREVEKFRSRGLPSHKSHPQRKPAPSRKRKVATALAS